MSQLQPMKPQEAEPVKYGDIFAAIKGSELAKKPVAPKDYTEKAGFAGHRATTESAGRRGISIVETDVPGKRIITEAVDDQMDGQFSQRTPAAPPSTPERGFSNACSGSITIGEALEAAVLTAGHKPVEWSDAAAIQAAEVRATGRTNIMPGGVAATAQSAATLNARATSDEEKTKLADVLKGASSKLPSDKPATPKDAEGVTGAEMRNDPNLSTHPTGVAASIAAAARINLSK